MDFDFNDVKKVEESTFFLESNDLTKGFFSMVSLITIKFWLTKNFVMMMELIASQRI